MEVPAGSQNDGRVDTGPPIIDRKRERGSLLLDSQHRQHSRQVKAVRDRRLLLRGLSGKHTVKRCASRPHDSTLFPESLEVLLPACTTRIVCSARATFPCTWAVSNNGSALGVGNNPGRRGGLLVVHHPADLWPARAAERFGGPESQRFTPATANPERSQLPRARNARHARRGRALSAHRLVGTIPACSRGSGECAPAGRTGRSGPPNTRAEAVPGELAGAVLGRSGPHVCARSQRQRRRSARADPVIAAGKAGGPEYGSRQAVGGEQ